MPPFERWGHQHLIALAVLAVFTVALTVAVRRSRSVRFRLAVRGGLSALLLAFTTAVVVLAHAEGAPWSDFVPLQLCDVAIFVSVYALLSLSPLAAELAYFWGASGTLIAMLTPDLTSGFPSFWFVTFFALHGGVVAAALVLTAGLGLRPRPGAVLRTFWITNAYAVFVGIVNVLTGANFMYLRAKPTEPSLLDHLGPWPVYILGGQVLALVLFAALDAPFRLAKGRALR